MELTNEFTVPFPPEMAWEVLTDLERIAPCLPGGRLTEVDGSDHRGEIKLKVGPITATYKGVARLVERDEAARRMVLHAEGTSARQGDAGATVTATLAADGDRTRVIMASDVTVAGKVAQFGHGVLADISVKLVDKFAACVAAQMEAEQPVVAATSEPSPIVREFAKAVAEAAPPDVAPDRAVGAPRLVDAPEPAPLDLLGAAGAPLAKRLAPVGAVAAALLLVVILWRRRR